MEWIQALDYQVLTVIADQLRADWLTPVMRVVTTINNHGEIWLLLAMLCLLFPRTRRCGAAMLTALALGLIVGNLLIKPWAARPRPFLTDPSLITLIPPPDGFSFPSGHTLSSFAAATACFFYFRKSGAACYVLAALIGFSRLYFCVHYPTDVLAGAVLGILLGVAGAVFVNRTADAIHFSRIRKPNQ